MSLEPTFFLKTGICENCGRKSLFPVVIEGHVFCSNVGFSCYAWKKEKEEKAI